LQEGIIPRGLDHMVHAVHRPRRRRRMLSAIFASRSARAIAILGHTQSHCAVTACSSTADGRRARPHRAAKAARVRSAPLWRDFPRAHEGLSVLVLEGQRRIDAEASVRPASVISRFRFRGARASAGRIGRQVAFSLDFASDALAPDPASSPASSTIRRTSGIPRFNSTKIRCRVSPAWCSSRTIRRSSPSFQGVSAGVGDMKSTSTGITSRHHAARSR